MLISECCSYPPSFEIHEDVEIILGHCSRCGEHTVFEEWDEDEV